MVFVFFFKEKKRKEKRAYEKREPELTVQDFLPVLGNLSSHSDLLPATGENVLTPGVFLAFNNTLAQTLFCARLTTHARAGSPALRTSVKSVTAMAPLSPCSVILICVPGAGLFFCRLLLLLFPCVLLLCRCYHAYFTLCTPPS